jgi:predicted phosphodiesterase
MQARAVKSVAILLGLSVLSGPAIPVQIVAGPYLQAPSETSMTLMWISDANCVSWVEYGQGESLDQKAHRSRHGLIEANQKIHRVTIEGLSPGRQYRYRVCSKEIVTFEPYKVTYGETVTSATHTFTTLDDRKDSISFIVLNDIHEQNEVLVSLVKLAQSQPFDLVFLNGDILGHIEDRQQIIDHVLSPCAELFARQTPFIYVRGNHETRGRFARRLADYIALPEDRYYYSFDHGPIHFVIMDGGEDKRDTDQEYSGLVDFDRYRAVQRDWLAREIQSEAFRKAPFRVVVVHMPPQPSERWHGPDDMYQTWRPLYNEGKIDLMIAGHTHHYEIRPPVEGQCDYPTIIGGAPQEGAAVVIRVDATTDHLGVTMTRDDGQIIGKYAVDRVKADSAAAP